MHQMPLWPGSHWDLNFFSAMVSDNLNLLEGPCTRPVVTSMECPFLKRHDRLLGVALPARSGHESP